uniref:Anaphase-promoting complex subunit 4 WD40 domain-containing protein n=1 Tax=Lotharella globosa TaxID=91324 RepID=A0A7S4DP22_9EUKA|mmetsp:Transcript_3622/g.7356  ORF Transcript_3622/g.7356 Transcript_3622/m.7356 type:complete len:491 (-) Transcript_3622:182-1654(-)
MISTVCWVPRDRLRAVPQSAGITPEQMAQAVAREQGRNNKDQEGPSEMEQEPRSNGNGGDVKSRGGGGQRGFIDDLDLDNYDKEDEGVHMVLGATNLTVFRDNTDDPYITVDDPDIESDEEDAVIRPTDFVLLAGHTEQEYSAAEVHVFDKAQSSIYVHHDIVLPSFPLALEYLSDGDVKSSERKNLVAVGTFEPGIEIWDLDVVGGIEPVATLGGRNAPPPPSSSSFGSKKKRGGGGLKDSIFGKIKKGSHRMGVMSLSWNRHNRAHLASGSADRTLKCWDLSKQKCLSTYTHHKNKVQCVQWNPKEAFFLLSGGYDQRCACLDVRDQKSTKYFQVDGEVQDVSWNPSNPAIFVASTDKGSLIFYDVRKTSSSSGKGKRANASKPLCTIGAHDGEASSVAFSCRYPHLVASASTDQTVKLWDLSSKPVCLDRKDLNIGQIFSMSLNEEDPDILGAGGDQGKVAVWDIMTSKAVAAKYGGARGGGGGGKK